jgi:CheY-like chemotaxis protein
MRAGKTVLIVGGEEEARISLAESLMAERYRVLEADSRSEGEALLRSHRPDLTVMMEGEPADADPSVMRARSSLAQTLGAVQDRLGAAYPPRSRTRHRILRPGRQRKAART